MAAGYSHTTRASGLTLTAAIYNADHQNHIDNGVPLQQDDYSTDATQMKINTDPGESGSESLATTQAGEIERLRFAIKDMKGTTEWYETPTIMTVPGDLAVTNTLRLLISGLTIATGEITATKSFHTVAVQTGSTDDLDTINGGTTGDILVLIAVDDTKDIVVKDGTGNIKTVGDFTMDTTADTITLIFDGSNWLELSRSNNT